MKEQDLLRLKEEVESAKTKVAQFTGQKNALMTQLKSEWKCDSIEEAQTKLKGMELNIDSITTKIEEGIKELEEKYNI